MRNKYSSHVCRAASAVALGWISSAMPGVASAAVTMTPLLSFTGSTGYTYGRPYVSSTGVVFGVLAFGGTSNVGSVYEMTKSGSVYTSATISSFTGGATGGYPVGGLTPAATGTTLYGAAAGGGNTGANCLVGEYNGCGVIYSLTPPASGITWTRTVIYTFLGGTDGSQPNGDLIRDSSGALYGTALYAGCTRTLTYGSGCGIVFKLTPPASGTTWTETVLYRFQGGATDGAYPGSPLAIDASGNLYGTTIFGGTESCKTINGTPDSRCGTVFKLTKSGSTYTESIIHAFGGGKTGALPAPGLAISSAGVLFGAATQGGNTTANCIQFGNSGCGLVFSLTPPATGTAWTEKAIQTFTGANGAFPTAPIIDGTGTLYGVTSQNSVADGSCVSSSQFYCGTVYRLKPTTKKYAATSLYSFSGDAPTYGGAVFGLAADANGALYGVNVAGSTSTVFSLTGSGYTVP